MKIKFLIIAVLATCILSNPLIAKEKHEPLVVKGQIDKATPAAKPETDLTELISEKIEAEVDESAARTKGETTLGDIAVVKELDKSSPLLSRDAASGLPTGKRQHKPLTISSPNDSSNIDAPRDAASGLPTGKRNHKPVSVTNVLDKSSTKAASPGYIKLGDIKGESQDKAADTSDDDSSDDCDDTEAKVTEEQAEACVDGHVTVLK